MRDSVTAHDSVTVILASERAPDGFYAPGRLYFIWDARNRILGAYMGHNEALGLPEFRPIIWEGDDAEPLRRVCAGRRAWVRAIARG